MMPDASKALQTQRTGYRTRIQYVQMGHKARTLFEDTDRAKTGTWKNWNYFAF